MSTLTLPPPTFPSFGAPNDRSVTRARGTLYQFLPSIESQSSSVSIDLARHDSVKALLQSAFEANAPNWDGFGAKAVATSTVLHAIEVLDSLPTTMEQPDISIHPDGEVGFFWSRGDRNSVAVAVAPTGLISFASLRGHRRLYGSDYLVNGLPTSLALVLRQLHSDEA